MYYSYVEIEYVATSFSPARTDLALKLLNTYNKLFYWLFNQSNIGLMITYVYSNIIESEMVAYHSKTGQKPTFLLTTCPKLKFDALNEWVLNITNKALKQI